MQRSTLEAVGLKSSFDIPAGILFSPSFNPEPFGLSDSDRRTIGCLRDFVAEYNREIPIDRRAPVSTPRRAAEQLYPVLRGLDHEEVWALFLSKANLPVSRHRLCSGSLDRTVIDTRAVVRTALEENASCVILFHNHPSGNPQPSPEDIRETDKLKKALSLFDMTLLDHIVITDSSFYSFADDRATAFGKKNT